MLVHYQDLKRDLVGEMLRIAEFLLAHIGQTIKAGVKWYSHHEHLTYRETVVRADKDGQPFIYCGSESFSGDSIKQIDALLSAKKAPAKTVRPEAQDELDAFFTPAQPQLIMGKNDPIRARMFFKYDHQRYFEFQERIFMSYIEQTASDGRVTYFCLTSRNDNQPMRACTFEVYGGDTAQLVADHTPGNTPEIYRLPLSQQHDFYVRENSSAVLIHVETAKLDAMPGRADLDGICPDQLKFSDEFTTFRTKFYLADYLIKKLNEAGIDFKMQVVPPQAYMVEDCPIGKNFIYTAFYPEGYPMTYAYGQQRCGAHASELDLKAAYRVDCTFEDPTCCYRCEKDHEIAMDHQGE